jgi:hypothetical protein
LAFLGDFFWVFFFLGGGGGGVWGEEAGGGCGGEGADEASACPVVHGWVDSVSILYCVCVDWDCFWRTAVN